AGGPREGAVEHVEGAADEDDDPADRPVLEGDEDGAQDGDAEPDERQPVGRQAGPAHGQGDRLEDALDPGPSLVGDAQLAIPRMAFSRSATSPNASGRRVQIVSRPTRRVWTRPATRRRLRWWLTRGWLRPTLAISSATLASPSAS